MTLLGHKEEKDKSGQHVARTSELEEALDTSSLTLRSWLARVGYLTWQGYGKNLHREEARRR